MTDFKLIHGIYESVINHALEERLSRLEENYAVTKNQLDSEESSFTLALHLTKLIANSLAGMHPGIDFGYFEFPEFADAVSGEIFLFQINIYGLPANTEIFCDFFDGEPSVFNQIKLFHCNIPETPKLSFFWK